MSTNSITEFSLTTPLPPEFPCEWATGWGEDPYGIWQEFTIKEVTQRLRWIPAGTFIMGSPVDEPERFDDEKQHLVTLPEGFWLADTACTQELWNAVTGKNPASFKDGNELPVESISWDDCTSFIEKVNAFFKDSKFCFPTEEQWEYACRAGTTTPFWFGKELITNKANYNGIYPYVNKEKGEYREKIVHVKSFDQNPWGLFQMHGNVWEWCANKYGDYSVDDDISCVDRVIRGGGWNYEGTYLRSSYRDDNHPRCRDDDVGFRLCRCQ